MTKRTEGSPPLASPKSTLVQSLSGCAFVFLTLTVSALMLMVNAVLCLSVHSTVRAMAPTLFVDNPNIANPVGQLFFFIGPVLLTIIQWHLLDRMNRRFRHGG